MSIANIDPKKKTIEKILSCGVSFEIPDFQREYSWDKENYKVFLDDILKCIRISDGKLLTDSYFMGAMIFVGELNKGETVKVVDGQQRLTTITILFSALSENFKIKKREDLSKSIFKYIIRTPRGGCEERILNTSATYPFFYFWVQDREKKYKRAPQSEEEKNIQAAYRYFVSQTKEKNLRNRFKLRYSDAEVDAINYLDMLAALRDQVLKSITVSISTKDSTQANNIFEILNAKGKRLSDVDLIKNKIFSVMNSKPDSVFADEIWNEIKKELFATNLSTGFTTYYSHFWVSKYKKTYKNRLYEDFKKCISENPTKYRLFLEEMKKNLYWYLQIINPTREMWENKQQYYLAVQSLKNLSKIFNITQSRIVLLALFDVYDRKLIGCSQFVKTIRKIEAFHYAYNAICTKRANVLEKVYSDFGITLRKCTSKNEVNVLLNDLFLKLKTLYPSYDEFKEQFVKLTYSSDRTNPDNVITKYSVHLLRGLEEGREVDLLTPDGCSIEHIISEKKGGKALNIGNLISLETTLNGGVGDDDYSSKRAIYIKSKYKCVQKFVADHANWSEDDIDVRAEQMAKTIYLQYLEPMKK